MKPPICHLCNRHLSSVRARNGKDGDLVRFADYQPLPQGMVGHPPGLEWFCAEHVVAAESLSDKPIDEAMLELRRVADTHPPLSLIQRLRKLFGAS